MTTALLLTAFAFAADDPWGASEDDAPPATATPAPAADAVDAPAADASVASAAPVAPPASGGHVPTGYRIAAFGASSGIDASGEAVVGSTGGTNCEMLTARWGDGEWQIGVGLPVTAYRTPAGREADIGNLQIDGWRTLSGGKLDMAVGVETHVRLGERAYTWVDRPDDLWPGYGLDVAWEARTAGDAPTTWMYRGALGFHGAAGYEPFPSSYFRFNAAAGVDRRLSDKVGLVGEASLQYWDTSPFELTGLVRADPVPGLRVRGGFVFPLSVYMGIGPSDQRAGLRETTALVDVSMSL